MLRVAAWQGLSAIEQNVHLESVVDPMQAVALAGISTLQRGASAGIRKARKSVGLKELSTAPGAPETRQMSTVRVATITMARRVERVVLALLTALLHSAYLLVISMLFMLVIIDVANDLKRQVMRSGHMAPQAMHGDVEMHNQQWFVDILDISWDAALLAITASERAHHTEKTWGQG